MPYVVIHYDDFDGDCASVESDMLNFLGLAHGECSETLDGMRKLLLLLITTCQH